MTLRVLICGIGTILVFAAPIFAQDLVEDSRTVTKAIVVRVEHEETREVPGTDVPTTYQTITVRILEGENAGTEVTVENDYLSLEPGEVFYLTHTVNELDLVDYYTVGEPYRIPALAALTTLFIAVAVLLGGKQGVRGLLSLIFSLILIVFVLLPGIVAGYSPILVSVCVASLIVLVGAYVTHGFSRMTTTAVLGMIGTIVLTGTLSYVSILWTKLSGFSAEEAMYLHFNSRGELDLAGLLLSGIIIGLLGVLYDAAIGQSVAVEELRDTAKTLTRKEIFMRALRMGREHIGALINTLAIAYVGAALPLLLLFYGAPDLDVLETLNREIFAAEAVRILVGSIGIILVVPVTTAIAVLLLVTDNQDIPDKLKVPSGTSTTPNRHIH